ncbi:major facilitator superfamily protein [Hirsutella rhossiliensis]|uniref:Major facilitator superfamily domain-containing protein n=1 Tax=Hirsutella rhossiliensis TaxID=111463 RepID=A0A9P8MU11_9HYPO|nr:major facilitator superfamily domain-containing protein [Hirsutella rhossiliensis]KAH0959187.1 major facilitator superfamily domain-containing protein [Hirsutella rhossiliensis]
MAAAAENEKSDVEAPAVRPGPGDESGTATLPKDDDDNDAVDGWRGWVVVAASSCSVFCYMGVIYSWGILQAEIAQQTTLSLTSLTFVGSLATSFLASISILVGKAIRRYGYGKTAFAGAFLLGLGEFLSSWVVDRLGALVVTHGILFGVGGGLTILPCTTASLKWFRKHQGLAVGVVFGGSSLGAAVMGVATHQLVRQVGIPWTFRILGFLLWAVCLPAACCIGQASSTRDSIPRIQWYRWKDPEFHLLFVGSAIACFPLFIPPYFIPVFARSISQSSSTGIIALTIWNISSTVGRIFAGFTADSFLGPINSMIIAILFCSVSALAIWPFASNMGILSLFSVISGIGCGSFFSLFPTVISSVFGRQNAMGVLPMLWAGWFFGYFFGTPIASRLYALAGTEADTTEYRPAAYYAGAMSLIGLFFMIALRLRRTKELFIRV